MKSFFLGGVVILMQSITPFHAASQPVCIEVKDRQKLPAKIYDALKEYKAILLGEIHGTNETPEYVEGMVDLWLSKGQKVLLGLEIYGVEQTTIDSFMRTGDFAIIKKMRFFNTKFKDGRSSIAMSNLIKSCYGKANLKIVCLDITSPGALNKDSMMAVCINNALKSNPGYVLISLTGNIHNKIDSNQFGTPMGYYIYRIANSTFAKQEIISLDIMFDHGTAWNCSPDCGVHQQSGYTYTVFLHPKMMEEKCSYDSFFEMTEDGLAFLFTETATASLPLNP